MSKSHGSAQAAKRISKRKNKNASSASPFTTIINPVTKNWSILSGNLPNMNDPRRDNKVHNFTQTVTMSSVLTTNNATPSASATYFTFNQLANAASLAALFDQYRITQLEVWAFSTSGTPANDYSALIKTVVDYDNAAVTATAAYFDGYENVCTTTMAQGHYRKWTPHIAVAGYTGAFGGYTNITAPWIDSATQNIQHYGIKFYSEATMAAVAIDFVVRFHFQMRNVI